MLTIPIVFDKFNRPHILINDHEYHITQMVCSPASIGELENPGSYTRYRIEYLKEEDYEQISKEDGLVLINGKVFCCKTDFKIGSKGLINVTFEGKTLKTDLDYDNVTDLSGNRQKRIKIYKD